MLIEESCSFDRCEAQSKEVLSQPKSVARFRCSQCKQVAYCSKSCQQGHWKKHRKVCQAWKELNTHIQSLPLEEAHRRFQQAQHTLQVLETHNETLRLPMDKRQSSGNSAVQTNVDHNPIIIPTQAESTRQRPEAQQKRFVAIHLNPAWSGTIEAMLHLNSFQITLKPLTSVLSSEPFSPTLVDDISKLNINNEPLDGDSRCTAFKLTVGEIMSCILPVKVHDYSLTKLADCISIRLQCDALDSFFISDSFPPITSRVDQMNCKACQSPLLDEPIERVVPLPSGYWQDISDYLICYSGQPAVHFGATTNSVPHNLMWADPSVWVIHPDHVVNTVEPLAADDLYGTVGMTSFSARFGNSWMPQQLELLQQHRQREQEDMPVRDNETLEVQQICCSYCCYPLGLSTFEGYYLYHHRLKQPCQENERRVIDQSEYLSAKANTMTPTGTLRHSIAIFVAQELKRYAESKAIFTFIVSPTKESANHHHNETNESSSTNSQSLLLHVVSWDSVLLDLSAPQGVPKRVVKVIYELSSHMPLPTMETAERDPNNFAWSWGGLDFCCDPITAPITTTASIKKNQADLNKEGSKFAHLILDGDEFHELVTWITNCPYVFPQEVVAATIRIKLGLHENSVKAGMAAMDLF